ncbi:glutamate--cysteine ligase [Ectothiorhodospira shaposhnikovii]|uniref:glutamate--cysteine ligase n=1 Tax=Ectothiorhodospira shaposhnikovii TaxID=1054 RepID=UPI001907011E|nr:glutamate--cysteine ligase [Ectothiorhodospira shaposhnikovii]MBK1672448.1 glutamate--cysteine ligase [Ectothiorhodospira shaposhnikovii]
MTVGQEIDHTHFKAGDFTRFQAHLEAETRLAREWLNQGRFTHGDPMAGFEIEAWLLDRHEGPAPLNEAFLQQFNDPMATPELAAFNIEVNTRPHPLKGRALSLIHREISATWQRTLLAADAVGTRALMTGILPTLRPEHLRLGNMSSMKRYRALNREVFRSRQGRPVRLDIAGREHLLHLHRDVMLEAATTSFQIHLQTPADTAHQVYNAAIIASAPMVAAGANAPFLFGKDLWDETRIPVFEQAVEVGGYEDVARGPLRRVSFGSGYARESILECFEENLAHFPVLLPMSSDTPPERFPHLRLHNGTIWRWNRPLIGFDNEGRPHIRIEHRVLPAGPTLSDSMANTAFFYGLVEDLLTEPGGPQSLIPFAAAKDNFYQSARLGLAAVLQWRQGERVGIQNLILDELLPRARHGLQRLGLAQADSHHYLEILAERIRTGRNGARWQRDFVARHGRDMPALTRALRQHQATDEPVHQWDLQPAAPEDSESC